jgi:hypothetical protein
MQGHRETGRGLGGPGPSNESPDGSPGSSRRWDTASRSTAKPGRWLLIPTGIQFQYIAKQVSSFQRRGLPVVLVDTKKKELAGDIENPGRQWQPKGTPEEVC